MSCMMLDNSLSEIKESDKHNNKRYSWHKIFIEILETIVKRCCCLKLQTSAIIVQGTQIIAMGYNGTFEKHPECNDYWYDYYKKRNIAIEFDKWIATDEFKLLHREWSKEYESHAESNALRFLSRNLSKKCVMYSLYSPCIWCAKDIIAHKIQCVYYKYKYKHGNQSIVTLQLAGIPCVQVV